MSLRLKDRVPRSCCWRRAHGCRRVLVVLSHASRVEPRSSTLVGRSGGQPELAGPPRGRPSEESGPTRRAKRKAMARQWPSAPNGACVHSCCFPKCPPPMPMAMYWWAAIRQLPVDAADRAVADGQRQQHPPNHASHDRRRCRSDAHHPREHYAYTVGRHSDRPVSHEEKQAGTGRGSSDRKHALCSLVIIVLR